MNAKETLEQMLTHLGFEAVVKELVVEGQQVLDIETDDPGRLIGRQGQTLTDLQYLLNRLVTHSDDPNSRVLLDVGGYRQQAREQLTQRAKEAAEKVRRWGDIIELEPMNAYDRRIVHQALKEDPDVETHSVEIDGSEKKVILLRPRRHAPQPEAR
ncbi:MAG TPA: R3H domain-containing nucleic acid-binding protein [Candidatus Limnocylindria bacterium]|jgi:spoIIIJ-associated protein|nr:R3H domain-containing nucleic acid-binding protein [Candidatus Limnocylindria bacterium]